jgi:RNA polymerase sigma-70 factor (ECF subfamily)
MFDDALTSDGILARAAAGDAGAWGDLLTAHEDRLIRIVAVRLDPRLRGRIDPADVVQEVFVEATAHREAYFRAADTPLFLWLRGVVKNKLLELHRRHLGTHMRDAKRELPLKGVVSSSDASQILCAHLTAGLTAPSAAAARNEVKERLAEALDAMHPSDCEVLVMRHFEQLTNAEAAEVLGIQERAAAKRYLRALSRLKDILQQMPGGLTEVRL